MVKFDGVMIYLHLYVEKYLKQSEKTNFKVSPFGLNSWWGLTVPVMYVKRQIKLFFLILMSASANRGHHLSVVPSLGKILIWGLRGIKYKKFRYLDIFSETGH